MELFSCDWDGRTPSDLVYAPQRSDKRVRPIGLLAEPKFTTPRDYFAKIMDMALQQLPTFEKLGVTQCVLNAERWHGQPGGLGAVADAMMLLGDRHQSLTGLYTPFRIDSGAWAEPAKDRHAENVAAVDSLSGSIDYVDVDGYFYRSKDGKPSTAFGPPATTALVGLWNTVQQVRILYPRQKVRVWTSLTCADNGIHGPSTDVSPDDYRRYIDYVRRMPGVSAIVDFSCWGTDSTGKEGPMVLTQTRSACRAIFAEEGSKQ